LVKKLGEMKKRKKHSVKRNTFVKSRNVGTFESRTRISANSVKRVLTLNERELNKQK